MPSACACPPATSVLCLPPTSPRSPFLPTVSAPPAPSLLCSTQAGFIPISAWSMSPAWPIAVMQAVRCCYRSGLGLCSMPQAEACVESACTKPQVRQGERGTSGGAEAAWVVEMMRRGCSGEMTGYKGSRGCRGQTAAAIMGLPWVRVGAEPQQPYVSPPYFLCTQL